MRDKLRLVGGKSATNERDRKGHFTNGNAGGPGRPPRQVEAEYMRATLRGCSLDDWTSIVKRAVSDAKNGNAKAREWLGKYVLGSANIKAPSPFQVVVNEEAGTDPVQQEVARTRAFLRLLAS